MPFEKVDIKKEIKEQCESDPEFAEEYEKLQKFKKKYKNNPVAFAEDMCGVKLYPWQKALLNAWNGLNRSKEYICSIPYRSHKRMLAEAQLEYMKAMKMDFWIMKLDCYEKYEKGMLVKTIERKKRFE